MGLPVSEVTGIFIDQTFLDSYPELRAPENGNFSVGLHIASRFRTGWSLQTLMSIPKREIFQRRVENFKDANGAIVFDSWVFNADRAYHDGNKYEENIGNIFFEDTGQQSLKLILIDHGIAFTGNWHNNPLLNDLNKIGNWYLMILGQMKIYFASGWIDLATCNEWIIKLQNISLISLQSIANEVHATWRLGVTDLDIEALLNYLILRATKLNLLFQSDFNSVSNKVFVEIGKV